MDFGQYAGNESKSPLVPGGTLAFVHINVREIKLGKAPSTSRYMDCELTILPPHAYEGRKIYTKIADPMHDGNSEAYKQMGQNAICRILEVNGASPANPAGYTLGSIEEIHNKRGAIKVRVEAGEGGYGDKNEVGEWLTPNPSSKTGNKGWADLLAGKVLPATAQAQPAAAQTSMFAQPAAQPAQTPVVTPAVNPQQPQPEATPAPAAAAGWGVPAPALNTATGQTPAQTPSPSNPAQTPAWMTQARP